MKRCRRPRPGLGWLAAWLIPFGGLCDCRVWYDVLPLADDSPGGGASGGNAGADAGGDTDVGAGGDSGGSMVTPVGGVGGTPGMTAGSAGMPSVSGAPAGGEAGAAGADSGTLPPLPCANPLVWHSDFSSDPTALDDNMDGSADFVARGGGAFPVNELLNGVWHSSTPVPLDTNPPLNFTGQTQLRVRMRDISTQVTTFGTPGYGGALTWINADYGPSGYFALFTSLSTEDAITRRLGLFSLTAAGGEALLQRAQPDADAFVLLEWDLDPKTGASSLWVDGALVTEPISPATRHTGSNNDQFATVFAPQGTAEFDEFWFATCSP